MFLARRAGKESIEEAVITSKMKELFENKVVLLL